MKMLSPHSSVTWIIISSLLLLIISINTYISRSTVTDLNDLQEEITRTAHIVRVLEETHVSLLKAESGQRGFLLTQDENYLTHYKNAVDTIKALLVESQSLAPNVYQQVNAISKLRALINAKLLELDFTVKQAQNDQFTQAIRRVETDEGRKLYDEIHNLFLQIKAEESNISETQVGKLRKASEVSSRNLAISFFTTLLLLIGVFFLAKLNIKNQRMRQIEMEAQNDKLSRAVSERTKELSLFSDELKRSNRELEDFAFVASHDLQEPLRKIMAFGDRLETQSDNLTSKQIDFLRRMRNAANRMSTLISDLLEFSRVSTRGKPFQQVDLNEVLENCIDDLNVLIDETKVVINIDNLPIITADPTQMQQLMFNLLANAIKFSQNEVNPIVHISVQNVEQPSIIEVDGLENWQCISVTDNGIGFDQEYANKIFIPFQRLHSRESFKGTGIGLAICRRIVERHNGTIEAEGMVDKGAIFKVTLPTSNYLMSIKQ